MSQKNRQKNRYYQNYSEEFDFDDFSVEEKRNRGGFSDRLDQKKFQRKNQERPPGLKGKAIGLYYRDLNRKKKEQNGDKSSSSRSTLQDRHYFSLPNSSESIIQNLLMDSSKAHGSSKSDDENDSDEEKLPVQNLQFKKRFMEIVSGSIQDSLELAMCLNSVLVDNEEINNRLKKELAEKKQHQQYRKMFTFRSKLPSYEKRNEILEIIEKNQVTVISGETGCGKTTQVAQFILDDAIEKGKGSTIKIVCTQPRRISAISVAERVAAERVENLGDSVGYQIRLEKALCRDYGSILYCTTGILLKFMQSDPALRDYSHIILDEIHERNSESDFIMTLLKQIISKRTDLKVILMSATLNAERFSEYYENCPKIHIPGFTFPITEYYLEDVIKLTKYKQNTNSNLSGAKELVESFRKFILPAIEKLAKEGSYPAYVLHELRQPTIELINIELIERLLAYICEEKEQGAILVFLPGIQDITKLYQALIRNGKNFPANKTVIYPLHSQLPTTDQKMIFKVPPTGVRKIIISTSIAETSVTIEDVVYVVDCGQMKLSRFDAVLNLEMLKPEWETLANAKQRRGRAGRVKPGECYRLYTRAREATFDEFPTPEMLRTPLEQVILQIKILQLGRADVFLARVLDPPNDKAIKLSLDLLRGLNALDENENLTPLGYHLGQLPVDVRSGKMILWASIFSCVEPVFAVAACLSYKDPFYCPIGKEEDANKAKLKMGLNHYSDHIVYAEAVQQYEKALSKSWKQAQKFCSKNYLSMNTLKLLSEMKRQFAGYLYDMNFLKSDNPRDKLANKNSDNLALVKAIICAGLFPNIATVQKLRRYPILATGEDGTVKIHPKSINARASALPTLYVTYFQKQKSTAIYLHDTTCVTDAAIIFAAPKSLIKPQEKRSLVQIITGIAFLCKQRTGETIKTLQEKFDELLEQKFLNPGTIRWKSQEGRILEAVIEFVSAADVNIGLEVRKNETYDYSPDELSD